MKKFEIDGSVLRIPSPFIKRLLKYRKRYRYMIEYFGNCETFEVWTKRLFGIEFIYSRKKSTRRLAYDPIPKDLFSKESLSAERIIEAFKGCSLTLMNSVPEGLFLAPSIFVGGVEGPFVDCNTQSQDDQGVVLQLVFKEHSCSDMKSTHQAIESQQNEESSDVMWMGDKCFHKKQLIDTGFSDQFNHFFLTREGTLIKSAIRQYKTINPKCKIATIEEVYLYALWILDKEGWATKIDPNPNNAL